jgi:hypothetical protein
MHRHRPLAPGPTPTPPAPTPSRPDRTLRRPATVGGVRGGRIESRVAAGGHRRPAERSRAATRIGASPTRYCHSSTKSLAPDLMYPLEESSPDSAENVPLFQDLQLPRWQTSSSAHPPWFRWRPSFACSVRE